MIFATANLLGNISATAVIFATQSTTCLDATVNVNTLLFDTVASGASINVPVEYENGTPVGTIVSGVVEIPNPIVCADAVVENSDITFTHDIPSGTTYVLADTTFDFYINGVLDQTATVASMVNQTFNIQ